MQVCEIASVYKLSNLHESLKRLANLRPFTAVVRFLRRRSQLFSKFIQLCLDFSRVARKFLKFLPFISFHQKQKSMHIAEHVIQVINRKLRLKYLFYYLCSKYKNAKITREKFRSQLFHTQLTPVWIQRNIFGMEKKSPLLYKFSWSYISRLLKGRPGREYIFIKVLR